MLQSFGNRLQEEMLMIALTRIQKIGVVSAALLVILLAGTWSRAQSQSAPAIAEVSKLRILYAGHPGSDREKDFVQFLGPHFSTVKTADLSTFTENDAKDFDVTILDYDGTVQAPCEDFAAFSRPLITVGGWRADVFAMRPQGGLLETA
jgi:hypothetical protein